jgi:hypothetical protein
MQVEFHNFVQFSDEEHYDETHDSTIFFVFDDCYEYNYLFSKPRVQ